MLSYSTLRHKVSVLSRTIIPFIGNFMNLFNSESLLGFLILDGFQVGGHSGNASLSFAPYVNVQTWPSALDVRNTQY
jgi:hypothetical protein